MTNIVWRTDWDEAPKDGTKFLVLYNETGTDLVTTAYFYWYTEDDYESFKPVAYWCLQDAVRDIPLDEQGPPEEYNWKWSLLNV